VNESTMTDKKSLAEVCSRGFSLILTLGSGHNLGDFRALRARVTGTFNEMEKQALDLGYTVEDARLARYALTAFIDETISRTDWEGRLEWAKNPLSLEQFGDNVAGDEFFHKLENLRRQADTRIDPLEVLYTCLALGFAGKYALADPAERLELIRQLGRELERIRPKAADLSPNWRPPEQLVQLMGSQLPLGIIAAVGAGVVFVVFIVLNVLLGGHADKVAETIQSIR